jgi:hypothetical protein
VLDDDEDHTEPADDEDPDGEIEAHAKPAPIERFHRTGIGTALAAGMLGLSDALEGRKDPTPAIVEDWGGGQPFKDPIVLRLDPDHPEDSIVMVRPWLKPDPEDGAPPAD